MIAPDGAAPEPAASVRFVTDDPDEAAAFIAGSYLDNDMRVLGSADDFRLDVGRRAAGAVAVDTFALSVTGEFRYNPSGQIFVVSVHGGVNQLDPHGANGRTEFVGPGGTALTGVPGTEDTACLDGIDQRVVTLDADVLDQVSDAFLDRTPAQVLTSRRPVSAAAARDWSRTVDHLSRDVLANSVAASSTLVLGATARLLAAAAIAAFAPPGDAHRAPDDRAVSAPAVLRRAVEYLESHADADVTPAEVARAVRVPIVMLQRLFRHQLGMTPAEYLWNVRLDHAHADLATVTGHGDAVRDTVAAVAARWGFATADQFSRRYRAVHGLTPAATLGAPLS